MVDTRFYKKLSDNYKLTDLAQLIGANLTPTISVQNEVMINDIRPIELAQRGDLTFLSNKKYLAEFKNTKASACIVPEDIIAKPENPIFLLKVKNPYFAYAKLIEVFYTSAKPNIPEISSSALISKNAKIGNNCYIGPGVVIEDNVVIGDDSVIEAGTFIDLGVVIGKRAKIRSNVSISYAVIGDDVVILPGARIGQDGFGFATNAGVHHKIYHTGLVVIGNNVEIGANTTIDRGSMNDTIIEDLCRIDNLVQIGHNVHIGKGSIIVAQAGIAGSSKIGNYCALGGQAGVAGHMSIADKVQIAAQGGVIQNINEVGVVVGGTPTVPIRDWHRQSIIMKQLLKNRR